MMVADGSADYYPRVGSPCKEWDTAAAQIILEESGGKLVDLYSDKPLKYNKENWNQGDFLASGKINNENYLSKLSAVIITLNEEKNIERCIKSLSKVADEIVVIDSFSKDKTEEICRKLEVKFIQTKWEGYSATKNFGNKSATFDWIISLDADEALNEELQESILEWKKRKNLNPAKFARMTNYCGSWVKHGAWYPDIKFRIFDKRSAKWEGDIHEQLIDQSKIEVILLKGDCLHYSYYSVEQHKQQAKKFSSMVAKEFSSNGHKAGFIKIWLSPVARFLGDYIMRGGFMDGWAGWKIATISAWATWNKYYLINKFNKQNENA